MAQAIFAKVDIEKNKLTWKRINFSNLNFRLFDIKVLAEWEILLSLNILTLIYCIRSDIPIPIFTEILHLL